MKHHGRYSIPSQTYALGPPTEPFRQRALLSSGCPPTGPSRLSWNFNAQCCQHGQHWLSIHPPLWTSRGIHKAHPARSQTTPSFSGMSSPRPLIDSSSVEWKSDCLRRETQLSRTDAPRNPIFSSPRAICGSAWAIKIPIYLHRTGVEYK